MSLLDAANLNDIIGNVLDIIFDGQLDAFILQRLKWTSESLI